MPTQSKWTPGPWMPGHLGDPGTPCECRYVLAESYMGSIALISLDNGIASFADGRNDSPPMQEAVANLHLIAAAPELFAALSGALGKHKGWRALARLALAKAEKSC